MSGRVSVQPVWCLDLPVQQQSVLLLAARGPDGVAKNHPCKSVVRAYRGSVLVAAARRRTLEYGELADSFMSLDRFGSDVEWFADVRSYFDTADGLPHHYRMHLMHGAQILGYKHPDERFRLRWSMFYLMCVDDLHLWPESVHQMDARLDDWGQDHRLAVTDQLGAVL